MMNINGPVKWGIIGCGDVCEVKSGPAFSKVEGSSLVAVMRRDAVKAEDFARRHHVPVFYNDASRLINDPNVNAIYIATPPESHEKYTLQALEAGKPVYVEKPVTVDTQSCQRMIDASLRHSVPVTVAHYRRELALFKRVKSIVRDGLIGKVNLVLLNLFQAPKSTNPSENWRIDPATSGGGNMYDLAPHQLDILYWIFGNPMAVRGSSFNQGKKYPAPDINSLTAIFQDSVFFQGLWSFNVAPDAKMDSCKIIGERGTLEFPFFASFTEAALRITIDGTSSDEQFTFPVNIQHPMIAQVVKYFQGTGPNPCSLEEALVTLNMIEETNAGLS